jgi:hypothetical protein
MIIETEKLWDREARNKELGSAMGQKVSSRSEPSAFEVRKLYRWKLERGEGNPSQQHIPS